MRQGFVAGTQNSRARDVGSGSQDRNASGGFFGAVNSRSAGSVRDEFRAQLCWESYCYSVRWIVGYVGYPLVFYSHFLGLHIYKSCILTINRCIHKENTQRRGRRQPGWVLGRGNGQGKYFPRTSILPEIIYRKGHLGGQGSRVIGRKKMIPTVRHPPRRDVMGENML